MTPLVTALIPNWNGAALLAAALRSLRAQTTYFAEILVVDNGSTDDSCAVAERFGARVLRLTTNLGFARAVNAGVTQVATPWVAVLNNDVFLQPSWLRNILTAALSDNASYAVGKLLSAADATMLDGAFDALCCGGSAWRCGNGFPDTPLWNNSRRIRFGSFTAILLKTDLFQRVGPLDEDFESYLEDVDFCLRCATLGLHGVYVPEAVASHHGSATLGRWNKHTVRRIARNQLLLVAKHYPRYWWSSFGQQVFIAQALWGVLAVRHGAGLAYLSGKIEGLRRFRALHRGRRPDVSAVLRASEREIFELQRSVGFDWYWRAYFALTGACRRD